MSRQVETGKFGEQEERQTQGCKAAPVCSHPHPRNTLWNLFKFTYGAHVRLRLGFFLGGGSSCSGALLSLKNQTKATHSTFGF